MDNTTDPLELKPLPPEYRPSNAAVRDFLQREFADVIAKANRWLGANLDVQTLHFTVEKKRA